MEYMPTFRRDRRSDKTTGSELTFDYVVHRLGEVDFAEAVTRLGFLPVARDGAFSDSEMEIDFLGERYRLSKKDGVFRCEATGGNEVSLEAKSIVCYYALSKARGEPLFDFCLIDHFAHGVFSSTRRQAGAVMEGMTSRIAKALDGLSPEEQAARFAAGAERLGMKPVDGGTNTTRKWAYHVFPQMPVQVAFYEADDEFPPDLRIYWDKSAIGVFDFEPLAVLQGCFINALARNCRE
ncbi:MAG: DUF3786 domain-containing protein [Spirochaetaceae bacterium]|nr:DUF3786 domain-containing protein [Spirochaetaceae bacterium]